MTAPEGRRQPAGAVLRVAIATRQAAARLVRAPSAPYREAARRRLLWQLALLVGIGAVIIIGLMLAVDLPVIQLMPPRGAPQLWPVRLITDFGKFGYVLWAVGLVLVAVLLIQPLQGGRARLRWAGLEARVAFVFVSVAVANLIGEGLKGAFGRARPFVGGHADVLQFSPLTWHEPFESLPSAHAVTAVALAAAVASVWPRSRAPMALYALAIVSSRVMLLAHHPSDVVAGALVAIAGTLLARYWFAARRLGFVVDASGRISPS